MIKLDSYGKVEDKIKNETYLSNGNASPGKKKSWRSNYTNSGLTMKILTQSYNR